MRLNSVYFSHPKSLFPGFLISTLIAIAAQFISDHYGAPAMLMALLFGISLNFLSSDPKCELGITFSARTILRLGIALLGLRISIGMISELGWSIVIIVMSSVIATIIFGLLVARIFNHGLKFAFLSSGSVAICGVSAAIAISAILPNDDRTEERLVFTVAGVTILSTIAMIFYPIFTHYMEYSSKHSGIFIGSTIHDVAQVVGAGFTISKETGDVATLVKLIRVAMLAPVILITSLIIRKINFTRQENQQYPPLVPGFIVAFIILAIINSLGLLPYTFTSIAIEASRWALLIAISAVGMKTQIKEVLNVGLSAISLLFLETIFIALFIIMALHFLH